MSKQNNKKTIKEVVIVEGKTDTRKLQKLFNVKTIETNGSALNEKTINLIKHANAKNGVILFLDPDYQGKKIRAQITKVLDNFKECYISKNDMQKTTKKIGIAEATDESIIKAFQNYLCKSNTSKLSLEWSDYLKFKLDTKSKRLMICNYLEIDYFNHKQLFNQLNLMQISKEDLERIINATTNK